MNRPTAVRLGKVDAGEQETGKEGPQKENTAAPIILWSKDAAAAALYVAVEGDYETGAFKQTIDFLVPPVRGVKELLKSLANAYPITHSAHGLFDEEAKRLMNNIEKVYTKDVNGDGTDELILTRSLGGIEVYDRENRIFKYKPKSDPKLYDYTLEQSFTNVGDHDEIFFSVTQRPINHTNTAPRDSWIVRVSPAGITEIHPVFPDHGEPVIIVSAVGMNKPGSKTIDELVIISSIKNKKGIYLSRHKLDGTGIDAPRQYYTDYSIYCKPHALSGSNQLVIFNDQEKMLYFITPDKPVNWIKTINTVKLLGDGGDFRRIGETQINNLAVLILEDRGKLYALDALGKFHTSMKPDGHTSNEPVAFMTLRPDSNKHSIIEIIPNDKTMESYLVIQSRDPGKRELTTEELEKAGKRFLTDAKWKTCQEELRLKYFADTTPDLAKWYCKDHNIPMPEIHSWEDIKNKLPGYYKEKIKESKESYYSALETRLFPSIKKDGAAPEDGDFKNIEEFKKWLEKLFVQPELVFSIQHISKGNIGHQRVADYYFEDLQSEDRFSQPSINVRTNGEHGRAFMALHKKIANKQDIKPAYYTIAW